MMTDVQITIILLTADDPMAHASVPQVYGIGIPNLVGAGIPIDMAGCWAAMRSCWTPGAWAQRLHEVRN